MATVIIKKPETVINLKNFIVFIMSKFFLQFIQWCSPLPVFVCKFPFGIFKSTWSLHKFFPQPVYIRTHQKLTFPSHSVTLVFKQFLIWHFCRITCLRILNVGVEICDCFLLKSAPSISLKKMFSSFSSIDNFSLFFLSSLIYGVEIVLLSLLLT